MPAAEIVATVSAIAGIGSKLAEAVKTVREAKALTPEASKAISEAQDLVISLQARLLELQQTALELQEENRQLRGHIGEKEEWALERGKYERKTFGTSEAVVPKGKAEPLYCVNCFSDGKLSPLTATRMSRRMPSHICSRCKSPFTL